MDWKGNQWRKKSNHFLILLFFFAFSLYANEGFALILGKNNTSQNPNVFGNFDSYRVYLSLHESNNFKETILLNEIEGFQTFDLNPTKESFLKKWNTLSKTYNKGLVYVSLNGGLDSAGFPYLQFSENEILSFQEIISESISNKKFLFLLDICSSRKTYIQKKESEEELALSGLPKEFIVFTSFYNSNECYYESKEAGSFFTTQILEALKDKENLSLEKFSNKLQKDWEEIQPGKEEEKILRSTWNTKQKYKILSFPVKLDFQRTLEYYSKPNSFYSGILYNKKGKRLYQIYFETSSTVLPKLISNVNQGFYSKTNQSLHNYFFNERSDLLEKLGFWKTSEKEFEFHHILEQDFVRTKYEISSNTLLMKRDDRNGKNLFQDPIEWIEHRFSKGLLILKLYKNRLKDLVMDQLKIAAIRYNYDENRNVLQEEFFDVNKKLVENSEKVAKYFYEYGTSGNLEKVRKYTQKENYIKHKPAIIQQKFNDSNQIVSIEYFETEEKPTRNEKGIQTVNYIYNNQVLQEILFYSEYGKLRRFGYSTIKFNYNEQKHLIEKSFYSFLKERARDEDGISIYKYSYDSKGRLSSVSFYDEHEKQTINPLGYHKITYAYNNQNLIRENFFELSLQYPSEETKTAYTLYFYNEQTLSEKERYNSYNQLLEAEYKVELENVLNPECSCKLEITLDKFYQPKNLEFYKLKTPKLSE